MLRRCFIRPLHYSQHVCSRAPINAVLSRHIRFASSKPAKLSHTTTAVTRKLPIYRRVLASLKTTLDDQPLYSFTAKWLTYFLAATVCFFTFTRHVYSLRIPDGISMLPTMQAANSCVLISQTYRRGRGIHVGDVVSFDHPVTIGGEGVKRVIGMSGDFVLAYTPGKGEGRMLQVPEGHCWVVGDNVTHSRDSRMWGPLPLALVTGKVIAQWSPSLTWFPELLEHGVRDSVEELEDDVD